MTSPISNRAQPYLRYPQHTLKAMFEPKTVAVIGATERQDSVGRTILQNLLDHQFGGTIYPVNRKKKKSILGLKAYRSVKDVPQPIDLAIIVTPAPTVLAVIRECTAVNVNGVIIISAGFKETGATGAKLEEEIFQEASKTGMRIIGPNCLGIMRPNSGLNASFAAAMARPGTVGFVSQSGALCASILDWSFRENVGFSAFVSIGSMLDVGWDDLITYLGDDPHTKSIVIYMETIGNARAFLSAAREVALSKPIIVIKPGRTLAAARAAAFHTGSWAGQDEVVAAAFRRSGVLRVDTIEELFHMAEVLAKQPRPRGPRLTIVTNAGGPGVLATDALVTAGGELTPLTAETITALDACLPAHWSHSNPVDILGDADADRFEKAVKIALRTQQIVAHESGVADTVDPLGGSYYVEALTDEVEAQAKAYLAKIDEMGGAMVAVEEGFIQREIQESAYKAQRNIESGDEVVVGVNRFQTNEAPYTDLLRVDETVQIEQSASLAKLRTERDDAKVQAILSQIEATAADPQGVLMPLFVDAVEAYATLGEICDALRSIFGEYTPESWV